MQDYIIFHPHRTPFRVEGIASISGAAEQPWCGTIYADRSHPKFTTNEDPFLWTAPWLYSYCHATQLRREARQGRDVVDKGSRLFFCNGRDAQEGKLTIDTVFVVRRAHKWPKVGESPPTDLTRRLREDSASNLRHFRHGMRAEGKRRHSGKYTYEANHEGPDRSFLPLDEKGNVFTIRADRALLNVSAEELKSRVPARRSSYPLMLTTSSADRLYNICNVEADTRVFDISRQVHTDG